MTKKVLADRVLGEYGVKKSVEYHHDSFKFTTMVKSLGITE